MKITNKQLKQIIKEELESVQQEVMAPYGLNPYKYPQQGTVGEYSWKASIMTGSNTASEFSMDFQVKKYGDKKPVVLEIPRIFAASASSILGKLNDPQKQAEALKFIEKAYREGKPKESPRYSKDFR